MKLGPYPEYRDSGILWLGEIPVHWEVKPIKRWVTINRSTLQEDTPPDTEISYVDIGAVKEGHVVSMPESMKFDDAPSRARRIVDDKDVIVSTVRSYLKAVCRFETPGNSLIASTGFAVLSPSSHVDSRFLLYAILSESFTAMLTSHSVGASYPAIEPSRLGCLSLAIPVSTQEQAMMAAFLDRMDRLVNRLIRAKLRLIELLDEQKQAVIHRAVTRGLDPDAPMKPSGIDWLSEIPKRWTSVRTGALASSLQTGPFGSQLHTYDYELHGTPVINPSHMKNGSIVSTPNSAVGPAKAAELLQHRLRTDDIIFARRGELGRCALVRECEEGWLCGTGSLRMRLKEEVANPEYLLELFLSKGVAEWLSLQSVGSTMENLNTGILARLPLPFPPRDEQKEIVRFIRGQRATVDTTIQHARREIELIREYRTRLISDVVTGKLDVRGVELPEPDAGGEVAVGDAASEILEAVVADSEAVNGTLDGLS